MSGIRNIREIAKKYKEAEIYFHQDLDGVCSYLAMRTYLESNNIKVVDSHIIQYGSLEFNVKNVKEGRLAALVDFAHVKDMFNLATDHHDKQAGASSNMSTHFKKSKSNVETISGLISENDVFYNLDIELIKTVDSADFARFGLKPEHIQHSIFNLNKNTTPGNNRFLMGLVVNRLLLALKNKRIKVTSLDGKNKHFNRNLLECLVTDSKPSLYSLYMNLKHYIKNATSYEWNMDLKTYLDPRKLPTQEELNFNLRNYILSRKNFTELNGKTIKNKELEYDSEFKIIKQFDIGKTYETGSYDRYAVFRNFPDADWICTIFKMGLIQISGNPFKNNNKPNIHLGNITRELLTKYKDILGNFRISLDNIKKINENESIKLKQKFANFESIGFKYNDLYTFYKDDIYYLPNRKSGDIKTIAKLDLDGNSSKISFLRNTMNKLYSDWTFDEKQEMSLFKIPGLNILENLSGGHPSITNIQGFNYLDERYDAILKYFGHITISSSNLDGIISNRYIRTYEDLMIFLSSEYLTLLKEKLKGKIEIIDENIHLCGTHCALS